MLVAAIASALFATAALQPAAAPPAASSNDLPVNIGRFNPEAFPEARMRYRRMPVRTMVGVVENIMREERCQFPGQNPRRYDIRVPYVVKVEPDGRVSEAVVTDMSCAPLEYYVGTMIQELARRGDYAPPRDAREARWYVAEARFTVR